MSTETTLESIKDDAKKGLTSTNKKADAAPVVKPRDVIPVKALRLRSDRPLELPGGQPPTFSIQTNELFLVEFHPAMQMYRIVHTPRAGSSGQPWERFIPASWGSFERAV